MTMDSPLHHQLQGGGPLLLILRGGDEHADASAQLAGRLTDHYTVLTYDRRGLSRSPVAASAIANDLAGHGADASRLLIAHEPPAPELLPGPERARAVAEQEQIEALYRGAPVSRVVANPTCRPTVEEWAGSATKGSMTWPN